jgi:hypothetical protein
LSRCAYKKRDAFGFRIPVNATEGQKRFAISPHGGE